MNKMIGLIVILILFGMSFLLINPSVLPDFITQNEELMLLTYLLWFTGFSILFVFFILKVLKIKY